MCLSSVLMRSILSYVTVTCVSKANRVMTYVVQHSQLCFKQGIATEILRANIIYLVYIVVLFYLFYSWCIWLSGFNIDKPK